MRPNKYIESDDGSFLIPMYDVLEWARSLEFNKRWQILTSLFDWKTWLREPFGSKKHTIELSTVFLGLDHSFMPTFYPIVYETMAFRGGKSDENLAFKRYTSREAAIRGHLARVKQLRKRGAL